MPGLAPSTVVAAHYCQLIQLLQTANAALQLDMPTPSDPMTLAPSVVISNVKLEPLWNVMTMGQLMPLIGESNHANEPTVFVFELQANAEGTGGKERAAVRELTSTEMQNVAGGITVNMTNFILVHMTDFVTRGGPSSGV